MGLINGDMTQMVENTINTSLGHLSIQRKGLPGPSMRLAGTPSCRATDIANALNGVGGMIKGHAPRVKLKGMVRSSESSRGVLVVGIDPVRAGRISYLDSTTR